MNSFAQKFVLVVIGLVIPLTTLASNTEDCKNSKKRFHRQEKEEFCLKNKGDCLNSTRIVYAVLKDYVKSKCEISSDNQTKLSVTKKQNDIGIVNTTTGCISVRCEANEGFELTVFPCHLNSSCYFYSKKVLQIPFNLNVSSFTKMTYMQWTLFGEEDLISITLHLDYLYDGSARVCFTNFSSTFHDCWNKSDIGKSVILANNSIVSVVAGGLFVSVDQQFARITVSPIYNDSVELGTTPTRPSRKHPNPAFLVFFIPVCTFYLSIVGYLTWVWFFLFRSKYAF